MKKTFSAFPLVDSKPNQSGQEAPAIRPAIRSLAHWIRRVGRWALWVSFVVGLFAAKVAHAKLGFMILLPCGLILIAVSSYLLKQVKFYKIRLVGRDAELFAYVMGGCALIGIIQVLVEKFVLHT